MGLCPALEARSPDFVHAPSFRGIPAANGGTPSRPAASRASRCPDLPRESAVEHVLLDCPLPAGDVCSETYCTIAPCTSSTGPSGVRRVLNASTPPRRCPHASTALRPPLGDLDLSSSRASCAGVSEEATLDSTKTSSALALNSKSRVVLLDAIAEHSRTRRAYG